MATLLSKESIELPPPPPTPTFKTVDIRLSYQEARALRDILWKVGGDARNTRRVHADTISKVLYGIFTRGDSVNPDDADGAICFKKEK